ncbi:MAG TPA: hypothetical protein VK306_10130 [Acidimicrobiales bacterium]|nr:hypothetical protein [Acidimicrobiales bacterium]
MDGRSWDGDLPGSLSAADLLGADLTARLERWVGEARVDDAARQRTRERWLRQAAEEGGTLAGVLTDLGERGTPVVVRTTGGRQHRGRVRTIGVDFVALSTAAVGDVLVALPGVASVRTRPGDVPATGDRGDRAARRDLRLADVLAGLAAERERALVVTLDGGDAVAGELRAMGRDVLVVRVDGDAPSTAYLPLSGVGEVVLGPR